MSPEPERNLVRSLPWFGASAAISALSSLVGVADNGFGLLLLPASLVVAGVVGLCVPSRPVKFAGGAVAIGAFVGVAGFFIVALAVLGPFDS